MKNPDVINNYGKSFYCRERIVVGPVLGFPVVALMITAEWTALAEFASSECSLVQLPIPLPICMCKWKC